MTGNKGKSISKILLQKRITLNVKGQALNKENDFTEQELRHIGLLNMIKYKRWDLLPFLGEGFFSFSKKDRQKILNLFVKLQDKLKLHFANWENFILNIPEYKLSEENVITIFAIIRESLSRKCSYFIFPYIAHPKSKIRIPAYKTLAVLKDDRSFPEILRLVKSPQALKRCYGLSALYYIRDIRMRPIIIEALKDSNKTVRIYALRALLSNSTHEYDANIIHIARDDANYETQAYAVKVLTKKKSYQAGATIANLMFHVHPLVRRRALTALDKLNYRNGVYILSKQLNKEDKKDLQMGIVNLISRFANSGGSAGVAYVLTHSPFDEVRLKASFVLAKLNARYKAPDLIKALKDKNYKVISESAWSLAQMNIRTASLPIFKVASNPKHNYYTRTAALYSLEKLNDSAFIIPIFELAEKWEDCTYKKQLKDVLRRLLKKRFGRTR